MSVCINSYQIIHCWIAELLPEKPPFFVIQSVFVFRCLITFLQDFIERTVCGNHYQTILYAYIIETSEERILKPSRINH